MTDLRQALAMWTVIAAVVAMAYYSGWRPGIRWDIHPPILLPRLWKFYRLAFGFLRKNSWMVIVPIGLYGADFLFELPGFLRVRRWTLEHPFPSDTLPATQIPFRFAAYRMEALKALFHAPQDLSTGFFGVYSRSQWLLCALIAGAVVIRPVMKNLRGLFKKRPVASVSFVGKSIIIASLIVIPSCVLGVFIVMRYRELWTFRALANETAAIGIRACKLIPGSIAEGAVLLATLRVFKRQSIRPGELLRETVETFPRLLGFNVLILAIVSIADFVPWYDAALKVVCSDLGPSLLCALTLTVPYFVVLRKNTLGQALRAQMQLLRSELFSYLLWIISGIVVLFLPIFVGNASGLSLDRAYWLSLDARLLTGMWQVSTAVLFYMALLLWFLDVA